MIINKKTLYHFSILTLLGFPFMAACIIVLFYEMPMLSVFESDTTFQEQIEIGFIYGFISSILALLIIVQKFFRPERQFFQSLIQDMKLNFFDVLFFSFCAGFGEEIFFRGAVQLFLGIWITGILFVALHGYLNPNNLRMSIYGFFMVLVSIGFGYLKEYVGLISAITAHILIDIVLFSFLKISKLSTHSSEDNG